MIVLRVLDRDGRGRIRSTLLKRLNAKQRSLVSVELLKWVYKTDPANGKKVVSAGLQNRRRAEANLFTTGTD